MSVFSSDPQVEIPLLEDYAQAGYLRVLVCASGLFDLQRTWPSAVPPPKRHMCVYV